MWCSGRFALGTNHMGHAVVGRAKRAGRQHKRRAGFTLLPTPHSLCWNHGRFAGKISGMQCGAEMNCPGSTKSVGLIALALTFLMLGCGGRSAVIPECRPDYDDCINNCADRCDQSSRVDPTGNAGATGPGFHSESANTWGGGCGVCVDQCRSVADSCKKRKSKPAQ